MSRVHADEPLTETPHRAKLRIYQHTWAGEPPCNKAADGKHGNCSSSESLWAKQTQSCLRALRLRDFSLSPAQKQAAPLKEKTLSAFWMLHPKEGGRGLKEGCRIRDPSCFYLGLEPDLCGVPASIMGSITECKLHFFKLVLLLQPAFCVSSAV